MKLVSVVWMLSVLLAGGFLVWQIGVKRESMMGALFGMFLTIGGAVIVEPSLVQQLSVLMVGLAIALLLTAFILMGWMWNVMAIVRWRRTQSEVGESRGSTVDGWFPWLAWYPVKTERGSAWMRFVQARLRSTGQVAAGGRLQFREVPMGWTNGLGR